MDIGFTASGGSGGTSSTYTEVANFASLPSASSVAGTTYLVIATTGVIFINRKLAGLYKSNGTTWDFLGDVTSYVNTAGGTAGQVLAKIDSVDFNTQWVTPASAPDLSGYSLTTHNHSGAYEPADATILKDADIGFTVQAYDADLTTWASITPSTKANTADVLAKAGGTMTGAITALRETKVAMGDNAIDLATGNMFTKTITVAATLTVSNWLSSGNANSFILELTNGGAFTVTWFSGVKWASGTAPTLTASGVDILGFYSHDGGTTVRGMVLAKDSK